jgi:hypothetical protein
MAFLVRSACFPLSVLEPWRAADVSACTQLLTGIAAMAFQLGDLLHEKGP